MVVTGAAVRAATIAREIRREAHDAALAAGAAALTISALERREIAISALELREIAISVLELREIEPGDRRRLELGQVAKAQPGVGNELDARARHGACVRADGT